MKRKEVKKNVKVEVPKLQVKSAVKAGAAKPRDPEGGWLLGN